MRQRVRWLSKVPRDNQRIDAQSHVNVNLPSGRYYGAIMGQQFLDTYEYKQVDENEFSQFGFWDFDPVLISRWPYQILGLWAAMPSADSKQVVATGSSTGVKLGHFTVRITIRCGDGDWHVNRRVKKCMKYCVNWYLKQIPKWNKLAYYPNINDEVSRLSHHSSCWHHCMNSLTSGKVLHLTTVQAEVRTPCWWLAKSISVLPDFSTSLDHAH